MSLIKTKSMSMPLTITLELDTASISLLYSILKTILL